jgi:uncharacterized membrane protein YfcA
MTLLVVIAATVAFAAAIQATMGFGFALVAVPIIAVAEDPKVAVVAVTAIGVPMTLWNTIRWRSDLQARPMVMIVGASLIGMPVGALILARAPDRALTFAIGIVVLVLTAWLWRGLRRRGPTLRFSPCSVSVDVHLDRELNNRPGGDDQSPNIGRSLHGWGHARIQA